MERKILYMMKRKILYMIVERMERGRIATGEPLPPALRILFDVMMCTTKDFNTIFREYVWSSVVAPPDLVERGRVEDAKKRARRWKRKRRQRQSRLRRRSAGVVVGGVERRRRRRRRERKGGAERREREREG